MMVHYIIRLVILPIVLISNRYVSADSADHLSVDARLAWTIDSLISRLPGLINQAVEVIQRDIKLRNAKLTSHGASIVWGAFTELTADWILNNRSSTNLNGNYVYTLGLITKNTAIGDGFPFLLGQESSNLQCGGEHFQQLVDSFGISNLGYDSHFAEAAVTEFGFRVQYTLNCVLRKSDEYLEASEVAWAIEELLSALSLRAGRNKEPESNMEFHNSLMKQKERRSGNKAKRSTAKHGSACTMSNRVGGQFCQRNN